MENFGIQSRITAFETGLSETTRKAALTETHLLEACGNVNAWFPRHENVTEVCDLLEAKIDSATSMLQALMSTVASYGGALPGGHQAQQHNIATSAAPPGM